MDTILARSICVRPENKIVMKCPSWPDTPLHQYFGARKSNQRKSDFAMSSLGYIRLYEYCCPCERHTPPGNDCGVESSFVHLEERLRSDGPFILYRRPPQRRVGLGLSERARERRLLKYYKYFQGFQRKLQVSRQFQQTRHKPENKVRVKKIISLYKSKSSPLAEPNSPKAPQSKLPSVGSSTSPGRSVEKSAVSEVKSSKVTPPVKTVKNKNLKAKNVKEQSSLSKHIAEMTSVLASMGTSTGKLQKRAERSTLMAPTLATIEEATDDTDDKSSQVAARCSPRVTIDTDLPRILQQKDKITPHRRSRLPESDLGQLRGILKNSKQTEVSGDLTKVAPVETTPKPANNHEIASSKDLEPAREKSEKPKPRPPRRTKRIALNFGTVGDDLNFIGELRLTEDVTLKKEALPKARRLRPVLKRSSAVSSRNFSRSSLEMPDEAEKSSTSTQIRKPNPTVLQEADQKNRNSSSENAKAPKKLSKLGKKHSDGKKIQQPPGNIIKFTGWDRGVPLGTRTVDDIPDDKDLCVQQLERADKMRWGVNPQDLSSEYMLSGMPFVKVESERPDTYVQENEIVQIFEYLTRSLVVDQPDRPLDRLQALSHDLAVQHANTQSILGDLQKMATMGKPRACSRYADTSINMTLAKLTARPKQRMGSILKTIASPLSLNLLEDSKHTGSESEEERA